MKGCDGGLIGRPWLTRYHAQAVPFRSSATKTVVGHPDLKGASRDAHFLCCPFSYNYLRIDSQHCHSCQTSSYFTHKDLGSSYLCYCSSSYCLCCWTGLGGSSHSSHFTEKSVRCNCEVGPEFHANICCSFCFLGRLALMLDYDKYFGCLYHLAPSVPNIQYLVRHCFRRPFLSDTIGSTAYGDQDFARFQMIQLCAA